ncbi:uncharacterized protein [Halyomorpha halys]|nr:uncharacterized protein LOC106688694 isoform X2 [Halyomorpha halys]XP_014288759.1 uncharacterized protein LOC106688694 isoform X2 [Halyomorpha halys]
MEKSTTTNLFATYGASKKKDYKAELLKELAADEDLFYATSTVHFLKRVKTMRYKYVTDEDVDETITTPNESSEIMGNSKIPYKSISLKNKTLKTFDTLWNMMKTLSDETYFNDKWKYRNSSPYPELHTSKKGIDSEENELNEEENSKEYKHVTKPTTIQAKFKGSKRFSKKKKIKPSNHKRKKGNKSNSTENFSNIVNISVRRLVSTPACKCKSSLSCFKKEITPLCCPSCTNKRKKIRLTNHLRPRGKNRQQWYKVNNTILLNVNNDGNCACGGRNKIKCLKECSIEIPTTEEESCECLTTTMCPEITTCPEVTTKCRKITTAMCREITTSICEMSTTEEDDECPDVFTCESYKEKVQMPCCLCSNNLVKELAKVHEKKVTFTKNLKKRKKYNRTGFKSSNYVTLNHESSGKTYSNSVRPKSTVFDDFFKKPRRISKRRRKRTTFESVRKIIASVPPDLSTSNSCFQKRKRISVSTSTEQHGRSKCIRRKCSTSKTMNNSTCLQIHPPLTEDSDIYDDDMKDTDYYDEYYEGYEEHTTTSKALEYEESDNEKQEAQAFPHHDIDDSTIIPGNDPALSAYNLLHILPFNYGKSSTTVSDDYEESILNKITSDFNPNILESLARKIYNAAKKLKNELDETRAARMFMKKKAMLVKHSMESLNKIQKRCNYLIKEINFSRKGYIKNLQQLLGLSRVRDQVEKRIKGKLHQILDSISRN